MWGLLFVAFAALLAGVECAGAGAARLVCYVENSRVIEGFSECTHLIYAGNARGDKLDSLLKDYRKHNPRLKIILRVAETDKVRCLQCYPPNKFNIYLYFLSSNIRHLCYLGFLCQLQGN